MGLISLYLFTLLGGLAAGTYAFETCFEKSRTGNRPWVTPLVVVILFALGLVAAMTHMQNLAHAFASISAGSVNFGSAMVREVVISACFFILAIVDLALTAAKGASVYALRLVTAAVGVICIVAMGAAYVNVLGNAVWCDAPSTVLTFCAGDLAMGLALYAALDGAEYVQSKIRITALVVNVVLAVALCLQMVVFANCGYSVALLVVALVVAPILSVVLTLLAPKFSGKPTLATVICVLSIVGVAISRYAFYATCTVL